MALAGLLNPAALPLVDHLTDDPSGSIALHLRKRLVQHCFQPRKHAGNGVAP